MLLAKLVRDVKNEEYSKDFFLWEKDTNRNSCRICCGVFTSFKRRHHCRHCGGLFCESCMLSNVVVKGDNVDRICKSCWQNESPGSRIRESVESKLISASAKLNDKVFTLDGIKLSYGSPYEPQQSEKPTSTVAPQSGYFEFINKSSTFCAVKIMIRGKADDFDSFWEVARPAYLAIPPNQLVHGHFGNAPDFELFILYDNPNIIGDLANICYRTDNGFHNDVAACAAIENFWRYAIYRIECSEKNVLLKFKGDGIIETRKGSSMERNGFFGKMTGSAKSSPSTLDFTTNISASNIQKVA